MYFLIDKNINDKQLKRILKRKNDFINSFSNHNRKYNNYKRKFYCNGLEKGFLGSSNKKLCFKKAQIS